MFKIGDFSYSALQFIVADRLLLCDDIENQHFPFAPNDGKCISKGKAPYIQIDLHCLLFIHSLSSKIVSVKKVHTSDYVKPII